MEDLAASFRSLLQESSDIIAVVDTDGVFRYVNEAIQRVLGHAPEEWVGQRLIQRVHGQDANKADTLLALSASTRESSTELRMQHVRGDWRVFNVVARTAIAESSVLGIVLTCHDVTKYQYRESRLRMLESVVIHANDVVLVTEAEPIDLPGPRIVYVNDAFTRMTGYAADEAIGNTPRMLQGPESNRATLGTIRDALKDWRSVRVDILNYRKDGSKFWSELSIVPVVDETGWYTHWIAIQRDVTQRKQVEAEIRNALERERELRELKSRFISIASHEFRTPLATILASSDLLKSFGDRMSTQKQADRLNKIQTEVKKMTALLDDVLTIGKAEAKQLQLHPTPIDLRQCCHDSLEDIKLTVTEAHTLSLEHQGEDFRVEGDENLLQQIVSNLLSNAIKYSPQGGNVTLRLDSTQSSVIIQVKDAGIGIPIVDQVRMFEPFHRASNVGSISGTGLGLSIIRQAVDLHGGAIEVDSHIGIGTVFTIFIPKTQLAT